MPSVSLINRLRRRTVNGGTEGLARRVAAAKRGPRRVKVGLPAGSSPYPDGTSVILVGTLHEFGSDDGRIPERSYMRSTVEEMRPQIHAISEAIAHRVTRQGGTFEDGLNQLGAVVAGAMQEKIAAGVPPPNAPSTIARKGSSKPLIDTGHLRQSITWQVVRGGSQGLASRIVNAARGALGRLRG